MRKIILDNLNESLSVLKQFKEDENNLQSIEEAAQTILEALRNNHIIYSCGNGGASSAAAHFAEELTGKFKNPRRPLAAIAINDPAYITCVANDFSFEDIYSRFIEGVGREGDVLLALSSSGNSENIIRACKVAASMNIKVIALTGKGGGKIASLADVEIRSPQSNYSDRAQEIHLKVIHILIDLIESEFFSSK